MASLKEIKQQIKSVKNTEKTTKAMKLVSNVKLKKAKSVAENSRAYAIKINEVLSEIAYYMKNSSYDEKLSRFFDNDSEKKIVDIIFITSDKGLCGGFNVQTIKNVKKVVKQYQDKNYKIRLKAVGKKGIEYFSFQGVELFEKYVDLSSSPTYEKAQNLIKKAIEDYLNRETDKIILVYNGYKNMITQEIKINDIVPIQPPKIEKNINDISMLEFEPINSGAKILSDLIEKYLEYSMYYALIDSLAGEHSSRMNAMENATNNAKERVRALNLAYNKARQSSITTELIEIISGVEAMK
ncbi:F0F1 ATP synthase subunit gamma [Campylobacter sp. FMV-PI01]|uniref:ATP synthase gamma chain n=1 Tax=Campylobacter portucalensis TaxID=2608384 RepID=A0A6L5WK57_9BACT|nr:ATP synthase F1 subunit gamma [Campylobacter portucalensis]MSN96637.1 F0F1 ATP synthase subunit gamma [Campylobacter portucalensis]